MSADFKVADACLKAADDLAEAADVPRHVPRFRMKLILIFSLALLLPGFNPNFSLRPVEG